MFSVHDATVNGRGPSARTNQPRSLKEAAVEGPFVSGPIPPALPLPTQRFLPRKVVMGTPAFSPVVRGTCDNAQIPPTPSSLGRHTYGSMPTGLASHMLTGVEPRQAATWSCTGSIHTDCGDATPFPSKRFHPSRLPPRRLPDPELASQLNVPSRPEAALLPSDAIPHANHSNAGSVRLSGLASPAPPPRRHVQVDTGGDASVDGTATWPLEGQRFSAKRSTVLGSAWPPVRPLEASHYAPAVRPRPRGGYPLSKSKFNSWPGASPKESEDTDGCLAELPASEVASSKRSPMVRPCRFVDVHVELVPHALHAKFGTGGGKAPRPASPPKRLAQLRPALLSADFDSSSSTGQQTGKSAKSVGFVSPTLTPIATPLMADRALAKSELLMQQMAALLEDDVDEASHDIVAKDAVTEGPWEHIALFTATPIAGRALEKSEVLLKELLQIEGLDDVDGESS